MATEILARSETVNSIRPSGVMPAWPFVAHGEAIEEEGRSPMPFETLPVREHGSDAAVPMQSSPSKRSNAPRVPQDAVAKSDAEDLRRGSLKKQRRLLKARISETE